MGFTTVLFQRDQKRTKDNKNKDQTICTLVVARLSSSEGPTPHTVTPSDSKMNQKWGPELLLRQV